MNSTSPEHILIAGLGVSGFEAALLALDKDLKVSAIDAGNGEQLSQRASLLEENGCQVILGSLQKPEDTVSKVVISPGIDPHGQLGELIYSLGCPVISELEFAASFTDIPLIGITGTNGKTTTVELLTHCLNGIGKNVIAAGNIGLALSKVVRESVPYDYIIVEVSSFQLEAIDQLHFIAGAVLNISSDHIDRYENMKEYADTKLRLLERSENKIVTSGVINDQWLTRSSDCKVVSIEGDNEYSFLSGHHLYVGNTKFDYIGHPLKGLHNAQNILVALTLLASLDCNLEEIYKSSLQFKAAPHRMQHFLSKNKIDFINDSKATNPDAMAMALRSLGSKNKQNIVLIAGGRDKKMDFNIVNTALSSYVRKILIYGECRIKLFEVWNDLTSCSVCVDFTSAVKEALNSVQEGDVLLLSPGCASLDAFRSYAERGDIFMKTVQEWTGK